ncbi:hypothetical protein FQR65_LT04801 [Abscondita terminalis]|nr:hypothetical protein FQR65_LT04801 [Abscondita terminalis]
MTEKDINDIFDDILLSEECLNQEGYNEGFLSGSSKGNAEGYHLGYHRGAEVGSELGYYFGIVQNIIQTLPNNDNNLQNDKKILNLLKLRGLIESFPHHNSEDVDFLTLLDNIRTLFKKVSALFKINLPYPEASKVSF